MVKTKFKQTEIGLIPEDWEVEILDNITTLMTNGFVGVAKIHYSEARDSILYIQGYNVKENSFNYNGIKKVSSDFHNKHLRSSLRYKDLLTIQTGDVGLTTYVPKELEGANCHALIISRFKENVADSKFISCYINSNQGRSRLKLIETGTTMKHINVGDFLFFKIPLPPLPEQQAIAKALSDTDAWIESLEKLIDKKRLIKQGAMQELLMPKEDWKEVMLGEVCEFYKGKGLSKKELIHNGYNECIHYGELFTTYNETIVNVKSRTNSTENVFLSKENDVLMPTSDVTPNGLATASCIKKEGVILGGDILVIRLHENFDGIYLAYFITENKNKVMEFVTGSTVYHIYGSELKNLVFRYPSYIEQTRIATILCDMDAEIEALGNKLYKAKQLKQGMMQELLAGRIRLVEALKTKQIEPKLTKGHNDQFNDAVLIGTMASVFGSDKFPLTRFKYTKVSYLLKRYKEEQDAGYLKHAAGPYKPKTRYGGAEKIAINKKYIDVVATNYKGKEYEGFVASENVDEAIKYFEDWYGTDVLKWIEQFKFEKNENLELWATVDMAIEDLKKKDEAITISAIKQVLKENKEWINKLNRNIFSDINIQSAIIKIETLFT